LAVKLTKAARAAVPGESVIAAGIFQAAGSLTARMSGLGEISVRRRAREERESSGLPFKRYMLLVLTDSQLHAFDARSHLTGWKAGLPLASWDRSEIRATADEKSVTIRLTLEIPSENRRIDLEAPKARRETSGTVARLLAAATPPPRSDLRPPASNVLPPGQEDSAHTSGRQKRAGWLGISGGLVRMIAYTMPWILLASHEAPVRTVGISGWRALGGPWLSVAYPVVIVVASVMYMSGRREATPRLLLGLGITSIVVFLLQLSTTMSRMDPLRVALQEKGLTVDVAIGFGVWVESVGAILAFAAGLYAYRLWKRTVQPHRAYIPPIPESTLPGSSA
jgi:hypothetical protein